MPHFYMIKKKHTNVKLRNVVSAISHTFVKQQKKFKNISMFLNIFHVLLFLKVKLFYSRKFFYEKHSFPSEIILLIWCDLT